MRPQSKKRASLDSAAQVDLSIRLREFRTRAGMRQIDAAKASGISAKVISTWETGFRIGAMSVADLLRLLDAYRVTPIEFFLEEMHREPTAEIVQFEFARVMNEAKALQPADCAIVVDVVRPLVMGLRRKAAR